MSVYFLSVCDFLITLKNRRIQKFVPTRISSNVHVYWQVPVLISSNKATRFLIHLYLRRLMSGNYLPITSYWLPLVVLYYKPIVNTCYDGFVLYLFTMCHITKVNAKSFSHLWLTCKNKNIFKFYQLLRVHESVAVLYFYMSVYVWFCLSACLSTKQI